jgi:hypothetical protein
MIMSGVSGSLGPDYYARVRKDGRTIISQKPDFSNRQFSEAQLTHQTRMQQAVAYAKAASRENPIYAQKAAGTAKNAYNVALGDWFNRPVIHRIVWDAGTVHVGAYDDVMVTKVTVSILDEAGQPLEQGEAEVALGAGWAYQAANNGRIRVEAWDLAGNVTRQEYSPSSPFLSIWEK